MESMPKDCFTFLGLCAVDRLTLSVLHIARDHILLYQKSSLLSASRRTELLGWMVARQFKPFMVFMASHFDYHPIFGSLAHDVTGLRFSSSPKGRDHEFGASARSLDGLGVQRFFLGLRTAGIHFQLTPTGCRSMTFYSFTPGAS